MLIAISNVLPCLNVDMESHRILYNFTYFNIKTNNIFMTLIMSWISPLYFICSDSAYDDWCFQEMRYIMSYFSHWVWKNKIKIFLSYIYVRYCISITYQEPSNLQPCHNVGKIMKIDNRKALNVLTDLIKMYTSYLSL